MLTVFYDGECGLCHRWIRILVAKDLRAEMFIFAPLGGSYFKSTIDETRAQTLPDSIVVVDESREIFVKSRAVSEMLKGVGGPLQILAALISVLPTWFCDFFYDLVARFRRKFFAKPPTACPFMDEETQKRFRLG